jgi:hypothetical protein
MKTLVCLLLGLSVLAAVTPAGAADCKVTGWTNGYGGAPIFECRDQSR